MDVSRRLARRRYAEAGLCVSRGQPSLCIGPGWRHGRSARRLAENGLRPAVAEISGARADRSHRIGRFSGPETACVKVECAIPPRYFTDYLTLLKFKDGWRIVSKTFRTTIRT
ncbi:MAG: nuclear transport factor 2 family protein [Rhodospirillales bacterium]|nr:nuclear transport factor 2 family protein [Rhodospirillales bacterium]